MAIFLIIYFFRHLGYGKIFPTVVCYYCRGSKDIGRAWTLKIFFFFKSKSTPRIPYTRLLHKVTQAE